MQFLSIEGDYALRAIVYLAAQSGNKVTFVGEIAEKQMIPINFLFKILRKLVRAGMVRSFRGPRGGYTLARTPGEISVLEVVEAVEGPVMLNRCLNPNAPCMLETDCKMIRAWDRIQQQVKDELTTLTIADIAAPGHAGPRPAAANQ